MNVLEEPIVKWAAQMKMSKRNKVIKKEII